MAKSKEVDKMIRELMGIQIISGEVTENDRALALAHKIIIHQRSTMSQKKFAFRKIDEVAGYSFPVDEEDIRMYLGHHEEQMKRDRGEVD